MENFVRNFKVFSEEGFGNIRTLLGNDGNVWFLSNDVTKVLGYKNNSEAVTDHTAVDDRKPLKYCDCSKTLLSDLWLGKDRKDKLFINESGLYCLIFGSKKSSAKTFKRWVTNEVLPSIRRNGGYIAGQENLAPEAQAELMKKVSKLSSEVQAQTECANLFSRFYDDVVSLYEKLKKENSKLSAELREALDRLEDKERRVDVGTTGVSTELTYFFDNFGNRYSTREEAVEAIKAARE